MIVKEKIKSYHEGVILKELLSADTPLRKFSDRFIEEVEINTESESFDTVVFYLKKGNHVA
jgi:hypothetical protein